VTKIEGVILLSRTAIQSYSGPLTHYGPPVIVASNHPRVRIVVGDSYVMRRYAFRHSTFNMSSIILELQAEAMDADTNLGSLLRKSLAVATKLQLNEWITWCKSELNGYPIGTTVPKYRMVQGEVMMFNPYNGVWMQFVGLRPVHSACYQSVAEVQDLTNSDGMIGQAVAPEQYARFTDIITPPKLILAKTSLVGILDAVRNTILDWTLRLEADGVMGEGMTFSQQEKKTVMKNETNYHIGNFNGVLGNVSGGNLQIGNYKQIDAELKAAKIPDSERKELKQLMEELPKASVEEKPNIVARGVAWTVRNAVALGSLSDSIREWFQK
jgi:hypothetical protein